MLAKLTCRLLCCHGDSSRQFTVPRSSSWFLYVALAVQWITWTVMNSSEDESLCAGHDTDWTCSKANLDRVNEEVSESQIYDNALFSLVFDLFLDSPHLFFSVIHMSEEYKQIQAFFGPLTMALRCLPEGLGYIARRVWSIPADTWHLFFKIFLLGLWEGRPSWGDCSLQ